MMRKLLLPLLAAGGLLVAIGAVVVGNWSTPPVVLSVRSPFASYIAGAGMVETSTENIAIGTPVSGIVASIYVKWGDWVNAGDPLFKIDDRDLEAQLLPAEAKVKEAEATLAKLKNLLKLGEELVPGRSITALELANRRFDVGVAEAVLGSTKAQVEQLKIEVERRTVRAPLPARVLQIKTHLGEFAQSGVLATPLMLLGDDRRLNVRVDIDENDAWRVRPDAAAVAFLRANPNLKVSLKFERIERYVIPKVSLTGDNTERTDMRVLQVLYSFDPSALPVYVGQQMGVYIDAQPALATRTDQGAGKKP